MSIQYVEPLSRGWSRTKKALFQPVDIRKWFVVGFTAFLAGLTDCHGGGGGKGDWGNRFDWEDLLNFPQEALEWLADNPFWTALIMMGGFIVLVLAILALWLSARGKFMFLDNVVHDRARVTAPWSEYSAEGNSLFLWSISFWIVVVAAVVLYIVECYLSLRALYELHGDQTVLIGPVVWMLLGFLGIFVVVSFVELLLSSFVVPIMYRARTRTLRAWSLFLRLFASSPLQFVGFGLLTLCLLIVIVIGIVIVGLLTCCVGFLLLAIPYLNSVVLLPVSYTLRAFSVEFLEQFGPDYQIFPRAETTGGSSTVQTL